MLKLKVLNPEIRINPEVSHPCKCNQQIWEHTRDIIQSIRSHYCSNTVVYYISWTLSLSPGPTCPGYTLPRKQFISRSDGLFRSQLIWPWGYKTFFMLNSAEHEIFSAKSFLCIFIFISRENFMLSWVEHEKSFITSGPGSALFVFQYVN